MGLFDFLKRKKVTQSQSQSVSVTLTNPNDPTQATGVTKAAIDARHAEWDRINALCKDNPPGRELDLRIAQEVTMLPGAGYWRRSSWTTTNWEPCKKGDFSPGDEPKGPMSSAADVYYDIGGGRVFAIPYYSTDANEMMRLIAHLQKTRHAQVHLDIFNLLDKEDWGTASISGGDCNCPHDKEYDPNDGHGWTYIDDISGDSPMHAVAIAALEFCKKVKPKIEKQAESAT